MIILCTTFILVQDYRTFSKVKFAAIVSIDAAEITCGTIVVGTIIAASSVVPVIAIAAASFVAAFILLNFQLQ